MPEPEIKWYKNDLLVENSTRLSAVARTVEITDAQAEDAGEYICVGVNRLGYAQKNIKFEMAPADSVIMVWMVWIVGYMALVLVLTVMIIISMAFLI